MFVVQSLLGRQLLVQADLSNIKGHGGFRHVFLVNVKPQMVQKLSKGLKGLVQIQKWIDGRVRKRKGRGIHWETAMLSMTLEKESKIVSAQQIDRLIEMIKAPITCVEDQTVYLSVLPSDCI